MKRLPSLAVIMNPGRTPDDEEKKVLQSAHDEILKRVTTRGGSL